MRDYAKLVPTFWTGDTGKALRKRGSEAMVVGLYLMSSPISNMLGLYYQPILYMAHETGLGLEGARKGLEGAIACGFCSYDEDSEMVWVPEMAKYQIASELKAADKRCTGIQKDYEALPVNPFLGEFFDKYQAAFHLTKRRGTQAPCDTLRSQEQEQEQEQDSPSLRSGEGATKRAARPKREDTTLKAYLEACREACKKPISPEHPLRGYCTDAGITDEMVQLAWIVFKDRFTTGKDMAKRQKDWPAHFANSVRGRWAALWFTDDKGETGWTSAGLQEKQAAEARLKHQNGSVHESA